MAETRNITNGINQTNKKLGTLGKAARLAGGVLAGAFVGQKILSGFKAVVSSASDAQQSLGATETVFGSFADTVVKDSSRAAKAYGLSANTYRENANLIGSLFKNQGVATKDLAGKTKGMIATASDLAATFGGTTTSAVEALGSAFKGEFDPLERYGISLKQSTVNAEASAIAQKKYGKGLDQLSTSQQAAIKQQATSNLVMKQSKDSAGAFKKETGTLAHQQQVLAAQFDNVKVAIGTRLLPILTKFLTYLTTNGPKAISAFKNMIKPVKDFFDKFKGGSGEASGKMSEFLANVKKVWASIKSTISSAVSIIQSVWNLFGATWLSAIKTTLANIMSVISGAFTVIQGIFNVFAGILKGDWSRVWDGIKQILSGAWTILKAVISQGWNVIKAVFTAGGILIKAIFKGLWNALKSIVSAAWNGIKSLVSKGINSAKSAISSGWNAAKSLTSKAWSSIKSAVSSGISKVISTVKALPGKVKSALGNLGSLLRNAGTQIIQGLINGIESKIGAVKSKLKSLTSLIPKIKGPLSYDKVMLKPAGQAIIQGLLDGFDDKDRALKQTLKATSRTIASGINPAMAGAGSFNLAGTSPRTYVNVKVEVPVGTDPISVGRELDKVLKSFYSATGGRR